ncbi:Uncharacterized protein SAPIO_CDS8481 [Scedosporium apiospermum]|uniref:Hsp70 family chaperone n=1 Tax=Pseudallescheria apiosperma TaxID=563466 RepID=A0A084FZQ7_PSEDA|nr:Uncharacterized protein SAPIO_CDS8481 [Scedosporium apiospermum]KEZ40569.1 Uncharacterized protein SAPIO_CDS8481 [Scedosporium apiospermum]
MNEQPDVIVAIDLGTTYTGVAWMTQRTPIQIINEWPGSGDRAERKVPTILLYNADGTLSSWGFSCADDYDPHNVKVRQEFFKIFIDQDTLEAAQQQGFVNVPRSTSEAERFATDYLRQIYAQLKETVEMQMGLSPYGNWRHLAVEFMFSVPTTWTSHSIINTFKKIIRNAGFGIEGPRHKAAVDLTEAQAAAVATLKYSPVRFQLGTVFLTVDAGGGTTDLALMQVTSTDEAFPKLSQMSAVRGVGVGATLIDRAFMRLVAQRFAAFPDIQRLLPPDYPVRFAQSYAFRMVKHKFGEKAYTFPVYRIAMEGVAADFSHAGLGIEGGKMVFSYQEIQSLFELQIEGITKKIGEQLDWLRDNGLPQQVQFMVLSGGLGSSIYVRQRLQQQFMSFPHPNAAEVAVLSCKDPQLVVVQGLLLNRKQQMDSGNIAPTLATTVARASYGVVVQEVYSPQLHYNEDVRKDMYDPSKMWAINQIQWLIKKGDTIDPNQPIVKSFEIRLGPNDMTRSWDSEIVMSPNEPQFLPRSLKQAGAIKLCEVKSNLTGVQQEQLVLREKRGTCFTRGYKFYICQFDVRVIVAPADLRFELWFGGQRFAGNHEPIAVSWDDLGSKVKSG